MKVIHESSKLYWKRKCTLDLLVVEHATFDVYELRSYEPVINVEGQPLYIDKSVLISMLNEDDVVTLIRTLKEPFLRRKEVPDEATIAQKARNDALAELILNRIHIEEYSVQNKVLVVAVINTLMDMERGRAQLCCAKPPGLTNYTWVHSNQHTQSEVQISMEGLDNQMKSVQQDTANAGKYQETARSMLTVRERWRVVLVFGKVARGRRLSATDTKIWESVSKNLQVQEQQEDGEHTTSSNSGGGGDGDGIAHPRRRSRPITPRSGQASTKLPQMSPRESVTHQLVNVASPRAYSVLDTPGALSRQSSGVPLSSRRSSNPHPNPPGLGTGGLAHSLESSLAAVPGHSMDITSRHHRAAAALDYEDSGQDAPTWRMHSSRPLTNNSPRRDSNAQLEGSAALLGAEHSAGAGRSRPQSALSHVSQHSPRGSHASHSPRGSHASLSPRGSYASLHNPSGGRRGSHQSSQDAVDITPKSKYRKTGPAPPPTACDIANQQLTAARLLNVLKTFGASIRSSFSSSGKVHVHAQAITAAAAAAGIKEGQQDQQEREELAAAPLGIIVDRIKPQPVATWSPTHASAPAPGAAAVPRHVSFGGSTGNGGVTQSGSDASVTDLHSTINTNANADAGSATSTAPKSAGLFGSGSISRFFKKTSYR